MYLLKSPWTLWNTDEARYATSMPKWSFIVGKMGPDTVRKFDSVTEASDFFILENAFPPRLHFALGEEQGSVKVFIFGQLHGGGNALSARDDGWDTDDSEGWYRFRYCRPTKVKDLAVPERNHCVGFLEIWTIPDELLLSQTTVEPK